MYSAEAFKIYDEKVTIVNNTDTCALVRSDDKPGRATIFFSLPWNLKLISRSLNQADILMSKGRVNTKIPTHADHTL